jgi:hypothetical protein
VVISDTAAIEELGQQEEEEDEDEKEKGSILWLTDGASGTTVLPMVLLFLLTSYTTFSFSTICVGDSLGDSMPVFAHKCTYAGDSDSSAACFGLVAEICCYDYIVERTHIRFSCQLKT